MDSKIQELLIRYVFDPRTRTDTSGRIRSASTSGIYLLPRDDDNDSQSEPNDYYEFSTTVS